MSMYPLFNKNRSQQKALHFYSLLIIALFCLWAKPVLAFTLSSQNASPSPIEKVLAFSLSENVFNQNQVGLYTHQAILNCQPSLQGAVEFTARNALHFYSNKSLQAATTYSCQLKQSEFSKASSNKTSFTSQPLKAQIERFGQSIAIKFNAKVTLAVLKTQLKIARIKGYTRSNLRYELTGDEKGLAFIALIKNKIERDDIAVEINSELSKALANNVSQTLNANYEKKVAFDKNYSSMTITGKPRFLAKANGDLAIRLYLPNYYYTSSPVRPFIYIDGIDSFSVSRSGRLYSTERKKYQLSNNDKSYFDISSPEFESGKSYSITIKKGLKAQSRHQLRQDQTFKVSMGDRRSYINFEEKKPYLSSAGDIAIRSVNTDKATVVIEHLLDQNYRYFINFKASNQHSVVQMANEVARKQFDLSGQKNQFAMHKLELKSMMKRFKSGVYRITLYYNNGHSSSKVVYFSDIGITTKVANDQMFVWVTKLSNANVISNATVDIYSNKNELIATSTTNKDGVAIINLKKIASKKPRALVVNTAKEQSFLYLNNSLNNVYTPYREAEATKYKTFIYLQSKLVRPGNDANLLIVLKDKNYLAGKNLPVIVQINDPTGYTAYKETLKTNTNGAIDLNHTIAESARTGRYQVSVKLGRRIIGRSHFSVENFIPQKIKNKIEFDETSLITGQPLKATLSSRYLFGADASNLKAQVKLTAVAKHYTNKNYKNYRFNNNLLSNKNVTNYLIKNKSFILNAKGEAKVVFDTSISQSPPSMLQAQLALTVFDDGRGVSTYKSIDLYAYKSMVGVSIVDSAIEKGEKIIVKTVAINPKTSKQLQRKLEVVIQKSDWDYYYDSKGHYQWNKRYKEHSRFYINAGENIAQTIDASGSYVVEVADRLSGHSATYNFNVSGWDYSTIDPTADMGKVQITLGKKQAKRGYKKGDILHIDIKSPIVKGTMLLTLESNKIISYKTIKLNKGVASLKWTINKNIPQGAYLRTHIVRSTATDDKLIPFRAMSSNYLKPDKSAFKQNITINAPKLTTSNHIEKITVTARPNSTVLVSVVDEGILQIKRQKPPKVFTFFERFTAEKIALYDMYDKVMKYQTNGSLLSFGSGAMDALMAKSLKRAEKHLAPKTGAKRVKPFVYWSHFVTTDSKGVATVDLPIPVFNGAAKIVAIAFNDSSIASASQSIIIKDDIVIKPTFVRFAHIGDKINVPIRLFNTTNKVQNLQLSTRLSNNLSLDLSQKTVQLKANSSKLISGLLTVNTFGKGEIRIIATLKNAKQFYTEVELPLTSAYALETQVFKGETSQAITFTVDDKYFSQTPAQLYISISGSYLSQLRGSVNSLIAYPHGCAEQTSSKVLAMLNIDQFIKGATDLHTKNLLADREHFIKEGIHKLATMQRNSGEFSYWKSGGYVNPYASIYASDVLLELKRRGFTVSNKVVSGIYKALKKQSLGRGSYRHYRKITHFHRMYAAYLLSREGQLSQSTVNVLYDNGFYKDSLLTRYMMAAILKEAQFNTALNNVIKEIEQYDYDYFSDSRSLGGSFYSKSRDLAFSLYLHTTHFKKNKLSSNLLEAISEQAKNIYSTQEKAFMMRAMVANYKDQAAQNMQATVTVNNKSTTYVKAFSGHSVIEDKQITIDAKEGVVNYAFEVSNFVAKPLQHLNLYMQTSAIKLERTFVNEKGNELKPSDLYVGDLFYSKIKLKSNKAYKNLVVSNRIPACFEIVNERLQNHKRGGAVKNSKNFAADYRNLLDDRVLTFLNLEKPKRVYQSDSQSYKTIANTETFYQPMRILTKGQCQFPAVVAEAMYDGRVTAYDKQYQQVVIGQRKEVKAKLELETDLTW